MGREQVALDAIGKKRQRALASLTGLHALTLTLHALRDPRRQRGALDGVDLHHRARGLERGKPGRGAHDLVGARQHHQRERAVIALRRLGQFLQRLRAILAGLAGGDAHFKNLLVGKQAHRAAGGEHFTPVEVRTRDGVHRAFGMALGTRRTADRIAGLLHQQGVVAVHRVEGAQAALQMGFELGGGDLHARNLHQGVAPLRGHQRLTSPRDRVRPGGSPQGVAAAAARHRSAFAETAAPLPTPWPAPPIR